MFFIDKSIQKRRKPLLNRCMLQYREMESPGGAARFSFLGFLLAIDSIEFIMIKRRHAFRKQKKKHRSETAIKIVLATALLNLIAELVGLLAQLLKR